MRSLSTPTFLPSIAAIDPAKAGIAISNGELQSSTLDAAEFSTKAGTTIHFHKGSWGDIEANLSVEDEPLVIPL